MVASVPGSFDTKKSNFIVTYYLLDGQQIESYYTDVTYSKVRWDVGRRLDYFSFPLASRPNIILISNHITRIEIVMVEGPLSIMKE